MNFQYKIRAQDGRILSGVSESPNRENLMKKFKSEGMQPIAVIPIGSTQGSAKKKKISVFDITIGKVANETEILLFTRDLLTVVQSGLPLVTAMQDIGEQIRDKALQRVIEKVGEDINAGNHLSEALRKHPKIFSDFYVNSIQAGEDAGRLAGVLTRLAENLEDSLEIKTAVSNATRYPLIVLSFLISAFVIMVTFIIPKISSLFSKFGTELPLPTRILITVGNFSQAYGVFLAVGAVAFSIASIYCVNRTKWGKSTWHWIQLNAPVFGDLTKKMAISKFTSTFRTLYSSGVLLPDALDISSRVTGNVHIESAIKEACEKVRAGTGLTESFATQKLFPPMLMRVISMGEKAGNLETMLDEVTKHYDREIRYKTRWMTTMIEPIVTVIFGLMILTLALGVFLPMWNMMKLFRGG